MREYELTMVLDPDLNADDQKKLLEKIEKVVASLKGKILKNLKLGLMSLAYAIRKKDHGFFYRWELSLPEDKAKEVDNKLKIEDGVIRYLLIKIGR